jgi:hypothetical protein
VATLTAGTDYLLNQAMGRFQLTASGLAKVNTGGAGIIQAVLAADASASSVQRTHGETTPPVRVAVKLEGTNARDPNTRQEIQCHSVMLTANGKLPLIGDKYTEMTFDGLLGANPQVDANSPYITLVGIDAPRN